MVISGLDGQDGAGGLHEDVVRIAAHQHLADRGPVTNADHAQVSIHFVKEVHYLFPRLTAPDLLADAELHACFGAGRPDPVEAGFPPRAAPRSAA